MVEWTAVALASILTVLGGILGATAILAAARFDERRLLLAGIAFAALSLTGVLSLLDEIFDVFDEQFAVEPGPLLLLVATCALLYLSIVRRASPTVPPSEHG